jgi:hypothetical protein
VSRSFGHFHQAPAAALLTGRPREFEVEMFDSPNAGKFDLTLWRENRAESQVKIPGESVLADR